MRMNQTDQTTTADVIVFDAVKRFRLIVMEVRCRCYQCSFIESMAAWLSLSFLLCYDMLCYDVVCRFV